MDIKARELFYLPNLLTVSRLLLILPAAYMIKINTPFGNKILVGLAILIIISDFLDGYTSRHFGLTTDMGKILDPIVDKLSMLAVLLSLTFYRDFPSSLAIFLIYRDIMIVIIGVIIIEKSSAPVMANFWGKLNTSVVSLTLLLYLVGVQGPLFKILFVFSHVTILGSGLSYFSFAESVLFRKTRNIIFFRLGMISLSALVVYVTFS